MMLIVVVLWHEPLLRKLGERLHGFHGRAGRLALRGIDTMVHVRSCLTLPQFVTGLVLGCAAWAATGLAFFLLLRALGSEISLQVAVFIYALSILAGAVSFLPGGLGTAEATMFGLLIVSGMRSTEAVAATILIRTVTLWFADRGIWFLRSSSAERKI